MSIAIRRAFALAVLSSFTAACGEKAAPPAEAPQASSPDAALTPLSSRDGGDAAAPGNPHGGGGPHGAGELIVPPGHPPIGSGAAPAADSGAGVSGTVQVAGKHAAQIKGGAIFVIARDAASQQVAAVRREETGPFPLRFALTASDRMTDGIPFSGPFNITARWSQSGDAMPAPGDIEGTTKGVALGARDVKIELSEVRP
jgi:cytochrome c-type biogenesis protein CcmH